MTSSSDYKISLIVGSAFGVVILPTVLILDIAIPYRVPLVLLASIAIMPLGLWFGGLLDRWFGFGAGFSKYVSGGLLSFAIDFSTLNIISYISGITAGLTVGWINMPGFAFATTNAYFLNKFWAFRKSDTKMSFEDVPKFLFVIIIGIIINSTVLVMITSAYAPIAGISEQRWLNIAKVCATAVAVMWNFIGYKFIVFKEKNNVVGVK